MISSCFQPELQTRKFRLQILDSWMKAVCIYGVFMAMKYLWTLQQISIDITYLWFEWMNHAFSGWSRGAFHGFPKICSQDCVFSVWGQWSACENQVRKREQREALPLFFTFQRGRAWQYMAIILIVLPYIYINIYGIWSVYIYIMDV